LTREGILMIAKKQGRAVGVSSPKIKINTDGKFRKEVIRIISKISRIEEKYLGDEMLIREQLAIDSLMAIEIIATIEKKFGLKLDEEKIFILNTLGEFMEYVESRHRRRTRD